MIPVFKKTFVPSNLNEISVDPHLASIIQQSDKAEWNNFWNFIRLSLKDRITTQETPDEIRKLQGKIEFIQEIDQFFKKILEKRES